MFPIIEFFQNIIEFFQKYSSYYVTGIQFTIAVAAITVVLGTILGALLGIARMSKITLVRFLVTVYIEFVRGVPLITQIFMFKFGIYVLFKVSLSAFQIAIIAISLNSAAYVAEIIRSGIASVDKGQTEAGRSLGLSSYQTMRHIIMPQAIKNILPALGNEFITLIKETSVATVIGLTELTFQSSLVQSMSFDLFSPIIISALVYFTLTFTLSRVLAAFERRLKQSD